ncbi:hypothetical protein [Paenibacillus senegalimassiliensis]|uniref:hypothetical protein n=1 Tax=Paenibacillus senegalimassiliensis TaxID=1737426 RepID=UPI0016521C2C|nr:hypothetical protein [Paenibacillus senegalimassiliensis]
MLEFRRIHHTVVFRKRNYAPDEQQNMNIAGEALRFRISVLGTGGTCPVDCSGGAARNAVGLRRDQKARGPGGTVQLIPSGAPGI